MAYSINMDFNNMGYTALCDLYPEGSTILRDSLKSIPKEAFDWRPAIEGAWTISEHVRHVVDSEVNFYLRAKLCRAEPGARILVLDEDVWAKRVYPPGEDLELYLRLFENLRQLLVPFLKSFTPEQADEAWVTHPERGRMTLKNLLVIYVRHVYFHLEYLERNNAAYLKSLT